MTTGAALKKFNLPALAIWMRSVVGVPPEVMGIGPAFAIPAVVRKAGLRLENIDVFEINEAFASQALFCVSSSGYERAGEPARRRHNGSPISCSGTRLLVSAALSSCKQ